MRGGRLHRTSVSEAVSSVGSELEGPIGSILELPALSAHAHRVEQLGNVACRDLTQGSVRVGTLLKNKKTKIKLSSTVV